MIFQYHIQFNLGVFLLTEISWTATDIRACISNCIYTKQWDAIVYAYPNTSNSRPGPLLHTAVR